MDKTDQTNMEKEFPILYARNKNGVWKEWKISVRKEGGADDHDHPPILEIQHGQHQGKMIIDTQTITKKKRGYDTLWDQAVFTAQSKWNHKHDREKYSIHQKKETLVFPIVSPMLAKTFDDGKHLTFPLYIQPKIDGLRCLAQWNGNDVCLYSRTGCPFQGLDPIKKELMTYFKDSPEGVVMDGELYSGEMPFEELSGYCRRQKTFPEGEKKVDYHVFDVIMMTRPELVFSKRIKLFPPESEHVKLVFTNQVGTMGEVETGLKNFIAQKYEGVILRNREGVYKTGYRSWDLQKYKLFQEEEFLITGYTEGTGREKGLVIWECQTPEKKTFHVRPDGDHKTRQRMFQEGETCIGKRLTVVFQEYTKDNLPRFPVGKAIRDEY